MFIKTLKQLKKILIGLIGGTIVLFGLVMILLPGTFIIIPLGLSILATEFLWAKKISDKLQEKVKRVKNNLKEFRLISER